MVLTAYFINRNRGRGFWRFNANLAFQFEAKWVSNRPGVTPAQFYEDVVLKLTEVVKSVRVDLLKAINGTNIYKVRNVTIFKGTKVIWIK